MSGRRAVFLHTACLASRPVTAKPDSPITSPIISSLFVKIHPPKPGRQAELWLSNNRNNPFYLPALGWDTPPVHQPQLGHAALFWPSPRFQLRHNHQPRHAFLGI
jgi:hypothetical protein